MNDKTSNGLITVYSLNQEQPIYNLPFLVPWTAIKKKQTSFKPVQNYVSIHKIQCLKRKKSLYLKKSPNI